MLAVANLTSMKRNDLPEQEQTSSINKIGFTTTTTQIRSRSKSRRRPTADLLLGASQSSLIMMKVCVRTAC